MRFLKQLLLCYNSVEGCGAGKYYVLNPELRREKTDWGETDSRCLLWITTQSSALIERKKGIHRASGFEKHLLAKG